MDKDIRDRIEGWLWLYHEQQAISCPFDQTLKGGEVCKEIFPEHRPCSTAAL